MKLPIGIVFSLLCLLSPYGCAAQLVVFGDSYSATATSYAVWHEYLAWFAGTTSDSLATGGATAAVVNDQVHTWLDAHGGVAASDNIYFVAALGNDIVDGNPEDAALAQTLDSVRLLQSAGATDIVVFTTLNMDLTPRGETVGFPVVAAPWMQDYNTQLKAFLQFDSHARVYDLFDFSGYLVSTLPPTQLWEDDIHMTTQAHKVIARDVEAFLARPPVIHNDEDIPFMPATAMLGNTLLIALLGLRNQA